METNRANYIIFHPDYARQQVSVEATAILDNVIQPKWGGNIFVDAIGNGNEDPFIFHDPWLYSYCHASQLKRRSEQAVFLRAGSILIFASGEDANRGSLTIDTFFLIDNAVRWNKLPFALPLKYQKYYQDEGSYLWQRHFQFPFDHDNPVHTGVSHTYEATMWEPNKKEFSFLPLQKDGERVSIPFKVFSTELVNKINPKVTGKYPVLLSSDEILDIRTAIKSLAKIKVLRNICTCDLI
jgi:hypothetical protein